VIQGRYDAVSKATRDCVQALARVVPEPKYQSVYDRIWDGTHAQRYGGLNTQWTRDELAVLDGYVAALVKGQCPGPREAAAACEREFARLRRRSPSRPWAVVPRNKVAVLARLRARALAAGWRPGRMHWAPEECRVCDRHVDALVHGCFRDARAAAAACWKELSRVRRQLPPGHAGLTSRRLSAVYNRISRQARELGWRRATTRWLPEERRILERYARALVDPDGPPLEHAARDCNRGIRRLHDRLRRSNPRALATAVPRTLATIATYLDRLAIEFGRQVHEDWRPDEDAVVGRHARALIAAEFVDAPSAARACLPELAALRRSWRRTDPDRFHRTGTRTFKSVYHRLCTLAHALKQRWPKTRWTEEELKVCRRWVRWYEKHRGVRRLRPWDTVGSGIQEEVERLNSRRSAEACQARFVKEWRRVHG
jgi:hypothetical protein